MLLLFIFLFITQYAIAMERKQPIWIDRIRNNTNKELRVFDQVNNRHIIKPGTELFLNGIYNKKLDSFKIYQTQTNDRSITLDDGYSLTISAYNLLRIGSLLFSDVHAEAAAFPASDEDDSVSIIFKKDGSIASYFGQTKIAKQEIAD